MKKGIQTKTPMNNYAAMVIIGVLFFIFGFVNWLNSLLIPYFKLVCNLNNTQSMLVAFIFYFGYFVMAIPSSMILKRTGFKNGIMIGLWIMAAGSLIFIPASCVRSYPMFLLGLFVQATGLTIMQTAANPYVTIMGPIESAARRISIMGVCNKVAGAIAPLIFIHAITKNPDEIDQTKALLSGLDSIQQAGLLNSLASRLIIPYVIMAAVLCCLGIMIRYSPLKEAKEQEAENKRAPAADTRTSILQFPYLILGALAIFFAVGVEVLAVDSIISYSQFNGYSFREAKFFATYTLLIMVISYITGAIVIPRYITQKKVLQVSAILGLMLSAGAIFIVGKPSLWLIASLGLCNALLWPSIWPLALEGLGRFTKQGSAILIMGVVGGAVMPLLYGLLSDHYDQQMGYWIMIPSYAFLLFYAVKGSTWGSHKPLPAEEQPLTIKPTISK
ncbi:sugar MFS transporter [Longitalea luteola]|uniref:sugar MFS transporter n=1 Tax=Longitalea luteola TaxID=2812563 RepID=UPI001A9642B3|nr:sugar MFS transporter [Longitalea luteola]